VSGRFWRNGAQFTTDILLLARNRIFLYEIDPDFFPLLSIFKAKIIARI
jgi:hypothetical protein